MSEIMDKGYNDSYATASIKAEIKREIQPEMASLTQIKAKLDETLKILKGNEHWPGLDIRTDNLFALQATKFQDVLAKLDAIAESQGKLLEAISGLRESGMRNHQQIRHELTAVRLCRKRKKGPRR